MEKIFNIGLAVVLAASIVLKADDVWAGDDTSSVTLESNMEIQKTWDEDSSTSTYSTTTITADGETTSQKGTVTANADGSVTQEGTITDPQGKTTTIDRTTTDEDGSSMVETTYTDPDGKTLEVEKIVTPDDDTGEVTEAEPADTDESGTVITKTTEETTTITTERSDADRRSEVWGWGQSRGVDAQGKPITRDVPEMDPNDESRSFNESVSVDEATKGKK